MKRGYKKGVMKEYPSRYCPYCGEEIPKTTRTGVKMRESKYLQRKTCGETVCYGDSIVQTRDKKLSYIYPPPPKDAWGQFTRGAKYGNTHDTKHQAD